MLVLLDYYADKVKNLSFCRLKQFYRIPSYVWMVKLTIPPTCFRCQDALLVLTVMLFDPVRVLIIIVIY